jgi:hypothetical protein
MSPATFSVASTRKSRGRPQTAGTEALMETLIGILREQAPMTCRGAFYAASVVGAVPKTEAGYSKVQKALVKMRLCNVIPWRWITDGTRWRRGPETFDGVEDALHETARLYRRSLWDRAEEIVEIWLEKEALAGVILPVCDRWTVDLMVCKGYPSLSYLAEAAEHARGRRKPLRIYYLGDLDPSGKDIPRNIRSRLSEFSVDYSLIELAVNREQVTAWNLPTRPTKSTDSRAKEFSGDSVELDAIPADRLRELVDDAINAHVDQHEVEILQSVEEEERRVLLRLAEGIA